MNDDIRTVSLIRGDGVGPEIADATVRALDAAGARLRWEPVPAGAGAIDTDRDPLPERTLESIKRTRLALKGPLATPVGGGFRSGGNGFEAVEISLLVGLRLEPFHGAVEQESYRESAEHTAGAIQEFQHYGRLETGAPARRGRRSRGFRFSS